MSSSTPSPTPSESANEPKVHPVLTVGVEALLAAMTAGRRVRIVDLRTPKEFAIDHLPGAVNVPIFGNEERAIIGTLYKRESPERAFEVGRERVLERIESLVLELAGLTGLERPDVDLVERVRAMTGEGMEGLEGRLDCAWLEDVPEDLVVLHCWRGGLRSRSVVALLTHIGVAGVACLHRGYQSYRKEVMRELAEYEAPRTFTIRGYTGTGKTLVLREVERLRPGWTLDLEGCAGHRSSTLGMVGLEPTTQKCFESCIAETLRGKGAPLVLEGESRKVGDRIQPARIWEAMAGSTNILLEATVARRIRVLEDDYLAKDSNRAELRAQLPYIEQRLGAKTWGGRFVDLLDRDEIDELVALLLEHYYDPLYRHSERGKEYALTVQMEDPTRAAEEIIAFIEAEMAKA